MDRTCQECGVGISHLHRFAKYCESHATVRERRVSPKEAIAAKCKDCIYDPLAGGTWRQQTEECNIQDCPLWEFRPLSSRQRG